MTAIRVETATLRRPSPALRVAAAREQPDQPAGRHQPPSFGSVARAATALPVLETGLLLALGERGNAALGPQASAPPPLDVFHDLRWVATYHKSWVMLVVELGVVLVARSAWALWLVGPAERYRAGVRPLARRAGYYLVASVVLLPFVALLFGAAVTHYSNLVIAGLPPALALALALHRGAFASAGHGRWTPTRRTLGWVSAAVIWVSAAGAMIERGPAALALAAAALSGLLNACALQALRSADELRRSLHCRLRRTVVPVAVADSAARLGDEVDRLFAVYHHPVVLVAESEGALVARLYLLRDYIPASGRVAAMIMLDMPRGPTHVSYPTPGREGWGVGSGWLLRGVASVIQALGPVTVSADAPFIRDLVDDPKELSQVAVAPPPAGVRQVTVDALADAATSPQLTRSGNETVVAAMHGGLMENPRVEHLVSRVLAGEPIAPNGWLRVLQHGIELVAAAWQVPSLPDGWRA